MGLAPTGKRRLARRTPFSDLGRRPGKPAMRSKADVRQRFWFIARAVVGSLNRGMQSSTPERDHHRASQRNEVMSGPFAGTGVSWVT